MLRPFCLLSFYCFSLYSVMFFVCLCFQFWNCNELFCPFSASPRNVCVLSFFIYSSLSLSLSFHFFLSLFSFHFIFLSIFVSLWNTFLSNEVFLLFGCLPIINGTNK